MTTHRQRLAWLMGDEGESVAQRIQAEVQEIYDVLRRQHPDAPQFELWNEALSLPHQHLMCRLSDLEKTEINGFG